MLKVVVTFWRVSGAQAARGDSEKAGERLGWASSFAFNDFLTHTLTVDTSFLRLLEDFLGGTPAVSLQLSESHESQPPRQGREYVD